MAEKQGKLTRIHWDHMGSKTNQPNSEFYQEKFGFNHEQLVNQLGNLVREGSVFMPYNIPKWGPRLPSGKHTQNYGKSQLLIGRSTISMGHFPVRYVTNYQRVWESWCCFTHLPPSSRKTINLPLQRNRVSSSAGIVFSGFHLAHRS